MLQRTNHDVTTPRVSLPATLIGPFRTAVLLQSGTVPLFHTDSLRYHSCWASRFLKLTNRHILVGGMCPRSTQELSRVKFLLVCGWTFVREVDSRDYKLSEAGVLSATKIVEDIFQFFQWGSVWKDLVWKLWILTMGEYLSYNSFFACYYIVSPWNCLGFFSFFAIL